MDVHLITDPPASGPWNMGVDEALRAWAAEHRTLAVRFYHWTPATLSLGYFQTYDDRGQHAESRHLPAVRRASGGGAIVHDRELTYSCALATGTWFAAEARRLVETFHRCLSDALRDWGVAAQLCSAPCAAPRATEPFLCFQRRACGDLLVAHEKVAGSAQRRLRGSLLQHGSVLLRRSAAATALPGISDLAGREIAAEELRRGWLEQLRRRLGWRFVAWELDDALRRQADAWSQQRFASPEWTRKR